MDWSDEYLNYGDHCPFTPNTMECDEHLCPLGTYSCGDGECVEWITRMAFQRLAKATNDCFSKRNLNYMCEVSPHHQAWTRENGLCSPDEGYDDLRYPQWNVINASSLNEQQKCEYLFRCLLSDNFERDCPCRELDCQQMMSTVCLQFDPFILYPSIGLINANVVILYEYRKYQRNTSSPLIALVGGLRCQGYFSDRQEILSMSSTVVEFLLARLNQYLCYVVDPEKSHRNFTSRFQNDKLCWNDSLTFNGRPYAVVADLCTSTGQCLSQYRIRDGAIDCLFGEDEGMISEKSYCMGNAGKHRFQCYNDEGKCLTSALLGTGSIDCSNRYDESWYDNGLPLPKNFLCESFSTAGCHRVKE